MTFVFFQQLNGKKPTGFDDVFDPMQVNLELQGLSPRRQTLTPMEKEGLSPRRQPLTAREKDGLSPQRRQSTTANGNGDLTKHSAAHLNGDKSKKRNEHEFGIFPRTMEKPKVHPPRKKKRHMFFF